MLIQAALRVPATIAELAEIKGVTPRIIERVGKGLLRAIAQGKGAPIPRPPEESRTSVPGISSRYRKLAAWRKEEARMRGVESDVVMTRETMHAIAEMDPKSIEQTRRHSLPRSPAPRHVRPSYP